MRHTDVALGNGRNPYKRSKRSTEVFQVEWVTSDPGPHAQDIHALFTPKKPRASMLPEFMSTCRGDALQD